MARKMNSVAALLAMLAVVPVAIIAYLAMQPKGSKVENGASRARPSEVQEQKTGRDAGLPKTVTRDSPPHDAGKAIPIDTALQEEPRILPEFALSSFPSERLIKELQQIKVACEGGDIQQCDRGAAACGALDIALEAIDFGKAGKSNPAKVVDLYWIRARSAICRRNSDDVRKGRRRHAFDEIACKAGSDEHCLTSGALDSFKEGCVRGCVECCRRFERDYATDPVRRTGMNDPSELVVARTILECARSGAETCKVPTSNGTPWLSLTRMREGQDGGQLYPPTKSGQLEACHQENPDACLALARSFERGMAGDPAEAIVPAMTACSLEPRACETAARLYGLGQGVARDEGRAFELMSRVMAAFSPGQQNTCEPSSSIRCLERNVSFLELMARGAAYSPRKYGELCRNGKLRACLAITMSPAFGRSYSSNELLFATGQLVPACPAVAGCAKADQWCLEGNTGACLRMILAKGPGNPALENVLKAQCAKGVRDACIFDGKVPLQ